MESLVLLLLLLACPVGMGVAMWLGARRGQQCFAPFRTAGAVGDPAGPYPARGPG